MYKPLMIGLILFGACNSPANEPDKAKEQPVMSPAEECEWIASMLTDANTNATLITIGIENLQSQEVKQVALTVQKQQDTLLLKLNNLYQVNHCNVEKGNNTKLPEKMIEIEPVKFDKSWSLKMSDRYTITEQQYQKLLQSNTHNDSLRAVAMESLTLIRDISQRLTALKKTLQ